MEVQYIDPSNTPELLYFPRDTGETFIDDEGEEHPIIVYDIPHEEETVATGKKVKKKVKNGLVQSVHLEPDLITIDF